MKSVLVVTSTGEASGVVTYVSGLARAVEGLPCVFATPPDSDLERDLLPGADTLACGPGRGEMVRVLTRHRRDFRRVQTHGARALLAARFARFPRESIDHVFHEFPRITQKRSWGELGLAMGVRRTANSPALGHRLKALGLPVSTVLPPLLQLPAHKDRDEARRRLGIEPRALTAAVVGRLHQAKNPCLAVDAVATLPAALRDELVLYFIGDGPRRRCLARRARKRRVRVVLCGHVGGASGLLPAFDLVVVPSRAETFGLTLGEAALADVPVAAVESPGSRLIRGDADLLPLAQPTPEDLGKRIASALKQDVTVTRTLRDHVRGNFCTDRAVTRYREYFEELLLGPSPKGR